jgi:serine protease
MSAKPIHGGPLKIYSLKRSTIPKIAVLATGLTAAILVATINPAPAQAQPYKQTACTECHTAGGSVSATPSSPTLAPSVAYTVALVFTGGTSPDGYWISGNGVSVNASNAGPAPMTAPATAGTYTYTVWMRSGVVASTTYSITVSTTPPPTTTTTTPPPTTTTTTPPPTTTTPPPTTTTTVPPTVITAPSAPRGVTAIPGNGLAVVSWTAPLSNGGSPVTEYIVTASPGGRQVITTGATTATVSGLTNGTSYTFTVRAANASFTSVASAPSAAVTPLSSSTTPVPVVDPGVIPVGAPSTGAGGASQSSDSPLVGLGGLALLLAGAAMVTAIRRRRV